MKRGQLAFWWLLVLPLVLLSLWGLFVDATLFLKTTLNGLTLASLYFIVASGFTLVFGLMRNVNLAHGSLFLIGAYSGWLVGDGTGSWLLAVLTGFVVSALLGVLIQIIVFRRMQGEDLRQTLVTIGLSIVLADLMLWYFGGEIYTFDPPAWIYGTTFLPIIEKFPTYRLVVLLVSIVIGLLLWGLLTRTRMGMMIRAGVDDRGMLSASEIGRAHV